MAGVLCGGSDEYSRRLCRTRKQATTNAGLPSPAAVGAAAANKAAAGNWRSPDLSLHTVSLSLARTIHLCLGLCVSRSLYTSVFRSLSLSLSLYMFIYRYGTLCIHVQRCRYVCMSSAVCLYTFICINSTRLTQHMHDAHARQAAVRLT